MAGRRNRSPSTPYRRSRPRSIRSTGRPIFSAGIRSEERAAMAIDYQRLKTLAIPEVEQVYSAKDTILYALGLGFGADPVDPHQLKFVYEDGLKALPTMPVVLAPLARAGVDLGINRKLVVHGEQGLTLHKPVPVSGTVIGRTYLDEIVDKGAGKGALLY